MPIDERRRDEIAAAVAAYDRANPDAPLPPNAKRLLAVMFAAGDTCHPSLEALAGEGFSRGGVTKTLQRLLAAGLLSKERSWGRNTNGYRLHLPVVVQP